MGLMKRFYNFSDVHQSNSIFRCLALDDGSFAFELSTRESQASQENGHSMLGEIDFRLFKLCAFAHGVKVN